MTPPKPYGEEDFIPISALQHFVFCERQWALIHLEQIWVENRLTVEGHLFHERVDSGFEESRNHVVICRGLRLRSLLYGITGVADVVEFHPSSQTSQSQPYPVEYKRGKPKQDLSDEIQLCAQALCLEEMLQIAIPQGALFYGETKRRSVILFDSALRRETIDCIEKIHLLSKEKKTPLAQYTKKCDNCSLFHSCLPRSTDNFDRVEEYLHQTQKWLAEDSQ